MTYRIYYVTPKDFMKHLEVSARETCFTGDDWDNNLWHPEDIGCNIETVTEAIVGYLSSLIYENVKQEKTKHTYSLQNSKCETCAGIGNIMQISTYRIVKCSACNGRG